MNIIYMNGTFDTCLDNYEKKNFRLPIKIVWGVKTLLTESYFRALRTIWLILIKTSSDLDGNKSFTFSAAHTSEIFPFIIKYPSICQYTADIYVLSLNRFPIYVIIMQIGL